MGYEPHSIEWQAMQWVDQMSRPAVDSATAADFDRWILKDPRHVESYARMFAIWQSNGLEGAMRQVAALPEADNDPGEWEEEPVHPAGIRWPRMAGIGAALCGFAALCTTAALSLVREADYATARGETRTVTLADGSTIRLNGDTRISVRIAPWSRNVVLARGEAFFDVAHERFRSFAVDTGSARISVLGTAFDIDRIDDETRLVQVYRGLVSVDAGAGRQWRLPAGSGLELAGERVRSLRGIGGRQPGWTLGWFEANDTTLAQLVQRLNRTIDRPITLADPALGELLVTGRFQARDPKSVLEAIAEIHDLRWRDAGDRYILER